MQEDDNDKDIKLKKKKDIVYLPQFSLGKKKKDDRMTNSVVKFFKNKFKK
jgi:hypothetical protein